MKGCDCGNTAELYTFCFAVDKFKNKAFLVGCTKKFSPLCIFCLSVGAYDLYNSRGLYALFHLLRRHLSARSHST